ncbi:MAG: protein phosphatase 2C domain-containing protein, partial [Bacteroidota bacterium]
MAISIKQPAALCEKGMREVNEDYIYPQFGQIDETQRFFMVCDGMGGEGKGDVAAKMVANHMANFLSSLSWGSSPSDEQLKQGLVSAEEALSAYMQMNPSAIGMGTTLSLIYLGDNEVTLAWVGNSPIFYFRKRNFSLTRAEEISASGPYTTSPPQYLSEIPPIIYGKESPAELNIRRISISEIQEGDYFFISSDGIMEQVNQSILATILHSGQSPEFLVTEIQNLSKGLTQDDFSCILIQVDRVSAGTGFTAPSKEKAPAAAPTPTVVPAVEAPSSSPSLSEKTSPEPAEDPPSTTTPAEQQPEEELAHSPFATRAFYMVLGACALLALIGVTLEGLGIGRVVPRASFENYVQKGEDFMQKGEDFIDARQFDAARQVLDSAITIAPDKASEIRITNLRNKAEQRFNQIEQMAQMGIPQLKDN